MVIDQSTGTADLLAARRWTSAQPGGRPSGRCPAAFTHGGGRLLVVAAAWWRYYSDGCRRRGHRWRLGSGLGRLRGIRRGLPTPFEEESLLPEALTLTGLAAATFLSWRRNHSADQAPDVRSPFRIRDVDNTVERARRSSSVSILQNYDLSQGVAPAGSAF